MSEKQGEINEDLIHRVKMISGRLEAVVDQAYPELKGKTRTRVLGQIWQWLIATVAIGYMYQDEGALSHTQTAIAIVNGCFRNNSSLEDLHTGELELDDHTMKILMMELTARVADWLICVEALSVDEDLLTRIFHMKEKGFIPCIA